MATVVMTMWSANSVPSTTTLSMPLPPSMETGALTLYETWFWPPPVRMSVSAAVEKPVMVFGFAIRFASSSQTISPSLVSASAKARMTNWSLSSPPSSRSAAWFEYTVKMSSPLSPTATSGSLTPALNQPRVVATVAKTSFVATDAPSRFSP